MHFFPSEHGGPHRALLLDWKLALPSIGETQPVDLVQFYSRILRGKQKPVIPLLLITNIHKQYGVYFVRHPLPGFELGTPTTI